MQKALYYPHTQIRSEVVLKNALLLWDEIETMVPHSDWLPHFGGHESAEFREATELVVRPRVPSDDERCRAHEILHQMVSDRVFQRIIINSSKTRHYFPDRYLVYPQKFMEETWAELAGQGLADWDYASADYDVPPAVGLYMMSVLADEVAGTQIRKVTDRADAYTWLAENHASILGSQQIVGLDTSQIAPAHDRLVTISLEVIDAREIPLSKLVDMRKREAARGGSEYSLMRRRYLAALESHVEKISKEAKSQSDVTELDRVFKETISEDLSELKRELKINARKTLFSKEVGISALVTGGALVSPIAGLTALGLGGIIPLAMAAADYKDKRREILQKHVMSWLFTSKQGKVTLY